MSGEELWTFTLEDDGRSRVISTRGVRFRNRDYVGPWMSGHAGLRVRVRFMPHHDHRVEVFAADTGRYLGPADLSGQADVEQIAAVRSVRAARARALRKDLTAAQRERYAAVTRAEQPKRLGSVTEVEAGLELAEAERGDLAELALPDLIPPAAPPSHWRTPPSLAARTRPLPRPLPPPRSTHDEESTGEGGPAGEREAVVDPDEDGQRLGGGVR
ncbi:Mu transposase C-terminal domain-containing protein [Streptomyces lavendulae]|uniref:Mu transposase C-terminal domain-containing protein n=1 Tax=Streptomyces lavendulae TaxID=1914 RepID=UPI0033D26879